MRLHTKKIAFALLINKHNYLINVFFISVRRPIVFVSNLVSFIKIFSSHDLIRQTHQFSSCTFSIAAALFLLNKNLPATIPSLNAQCTLSFVSLKKKEKSISTLFCDHYAKCNLWLMVCQTCWKMNFADVLLAFSVWNH